MFIFSAYTRGRVFLGETDRRLTDTRAYTCGLKVNSSAQVHSKHSGRPKQPRGVCQAVCRFEQTQAHTPTNEPTQKSQENDTFF